ncbi:MAG: SUMF1/EgtB/PvdO family nonheme iron enzyme [Chloroflexi bacterium]|nr:SUMF1/EgtB/PvdO family nonheme iron enzyme [Chloroflexota bacterium]
MKYLHGLLLLLIVLLLLGCSFEADTPAPPTATPAAAAPTIIYTPQSLPTIATQPPPPPPTRAATATAAPVAAGSTPVPQAAINSEMVDIPAGPFKMGSDNGAPDAKPQSEVNLPAYRIDKFEVINADFKKFADATGYKTESEKSGDTDTWLSYAKSKDQNPVVKVSWNDADAFCKWAGKRLPTEQEWEKAARGADGRAYPWGNDFDPKKANSKEGGVRATTVVGSYGAGASPFGVQDMAGNVSEWTASEPAVYPGGARTGKIFTPGTRIVRGGGWFDTKEYVSAFVRNSGVLSAANDDLGFRCAK